MNAMPAEKLETLGDSLLVRAASMKPGDIAQELIIVLQEAMGPQFENIRIYDLTGTTRFIYAADRVDQGTGTSDPVVLKVDRPETLIESVRSLRHVGRGYNTLSETKVQQDLPDAEKHNIIRSDGSRSLEDKGWAGVAKVERLWESRSLEKRLEEGVLSAQQTQKLFLDVFDAMTYMKARGYLHRDLKPSNILVNEQYEARVIDLANAGKIEDLEEKVQPTQGGHFQADPVTCTGYIPGTAAYSEQSDLYALGIDMLRALTGQYWWEIHEEEERAIVIRKGQSLEEAQEADATLLDAHGMLSFKKYDCVLKAGLKALKGDKKKFRPMLERMLTLDQKKRYKDIEEAHKDLERILEPTKWERRRNNLMNGAFYSTVVAAAVALGCMSYALLDQEGAHELVERAQKSAEVLVTEVQKPVDDGNRNFSNNTFVYDDPFPVIPEWDSGKMRVTNNIFAFHPEFSKGSKRSPDDPLVESERVKYFRVKPGDEVRFMLLGDGVSLPTFTDYKTNGEEYQNFRTIPYIPAQVYLEGYEPVDGTVLVYPADSGGAHMYGGPMNVNSHIVIPEDLKPGTYLLVFEAYAPDCQMKKHTREWCESFAWPEAGTVIAREARPVFVGDQNDIIVYEYNDTFNAELYLEHVHRFDDHEKDQITMDVDMLGPYGRRNIVNEETYYNGHTEAGIDFPEEYDGTEALEVRVQNQQGFMLQTWLPVGQKPDKFGFLKWDLVEHDDTWPYKLIEWREQTQGWDE